MTTRNMVFDDDANVFILVRGRKTNIQDNDETGYAVLLLRPGDVSVAGRR